MKDLASVGKNEQNEFFQSFDFVFCDIDGVLWHLQKIIPGAIEAIKSLKCLGKKIIYVTNNSTKSQEDYYSQMKSAGFVLNKSDLFRPALGIIDFLKKRNFSQEICLLGMTPIRKELEDAGFKIEKFNYENSEESIAEYIKACLSINKNVGAVVADLDLNLTLCQVQRAANYLKNPDVLFITGGSEKKLGFGSGPTIVGPGAYHEILEDMSGRKPHTIAKPSLEFDRFIREKVDVKDSSKVLFIGDSVNEDLGFATKCGYRKLLVLSGVTTKESMQKWAFPPEYKPQYYVTSLKAIYEIIGKIQ